ncbi:Glucose-6-phosphate 1-dehydrogenase [uncultured Desulfobacterium sp.]|uniref:Glucose-6-phosphate 1-dehydrogenase n=1 Tax=uncultured Desulfobacterium sp. TaxID=201089 RepID=A0A445MYW7_9BACT|nr:Glucose-6-phosphate 1-dehydrogenase [uncultured Desulfobacterium sp.]
METIVNDYLESASRSCIINQRAEPCTVVVLGASGDLTTRKIVPSIFRLFLNGDLPEPCNIIGCGRTGMSDIEFRNKMQKACLAPGMTKDSEWGRFSRSLFYRSIDYDNPESFKGLKDEILGPGRDPLMHGNRIFYLAVPPWLYEGIVHTLGMTGLASESQDRSGWSRLVVEKPFGHDLASAMKLDRSIHGYFHEDQIFRIDHYLAKETVQNILTFRFANAIFEPLWNRNYIDHVHIIAAEALGVEHRAGYYEKAGVLRDMFQNHMMQLLALTAMEPPSRFETDRVMDEKAKVYRSLRPFNTKNMRDNLVLGQYGPGLVDGKMVKGYREEKGVAPDSLTPTFAMIKVMLDNWRWNGVPFYLTSGKRLARKQTEIHIQFKKVPHSMFRHTLMEEIIANRLILGIYPDEKISMTFQTKNPGPKMCLRSVTMDFNYYKDHSGPVMDAYEKVLLDCMLGDHMLFCRQDAVELCWSFLTPVLEGCEKCSNRAQSLLPYPAGTWGPDAFKSLDML